jgi:hypothetical protein
VFKKCEWEMKKKKRKREEEGIHQYARTKNYTVINPKAFIRNDTTNHKKIKHEPTRSDPLFILL